MMMKKTPALTCALLMASAAQAHITLEQREAEAGSAYRAVFKVGHGCSGEATRRVAVTLPAGFAEVQAQARPGWTLAQGPTEVSWTASSEADHLPNDQRDTFVLLGRLPGQAGPLWFKVRQVCVNSEANWAEVPAEGGSTKGLKSPAALLTVTPRP